MFTDSEIRLLQASNEGFPLVQAAQAAYNSCGKCGHRPVNVHSLLRIAINKYKSDKQFITHLSTLMQLPVSIAGVFIGK